MVTDISNKYRKDFPFFKSIDEHNSKENDHLIYLDTSATAQRPYLVLDAMSHFYATENANPLRGLYDLSERATIAYEHSRDETARFINAKESCEIIFTRNTTESLNLVAYSYGLSTVKAGDEICITIMEHRSNIVPWQMVCRQTGAKLVFLECDKATGKISDEEINSKITEKTKIVSCAHISNVLGVTNPIKKIAQKAHSVGAVMIVDGAQSAPHIKIDVQDLDADFFALSGHKLCGPMGIGALYGKKEFLEKMPPFLTGGEMIEYVTRDNATWAELPHKFEAGTVSAADAVGMAAAIRYLNSVGFENIEAQDALLTKRLMDGMKKIPHIHFVGTDIPEDRTGIVTFTLDGVHPHDIATLLSDERIAIRAGHHCAQPLGQFMGVQSSARASLYFYNTVEEIDIFLEKLAKLREWSGYKD
ncbi:MAG: SufS family cysteine desulfurase [Treponema sp.]|nr:SufS family cysteine desulfurase [Treponema sp.]